MKEGDDDEEDWVYWTSTNGEEWYVSNPIIDSSVFFRDLTDLDNSNQSNQSAKYIIGALGRI